MTTYWENWYDRTNVFNEFVFNTRIDDNSNVVHVDTHVIDEDSIAVPLSHTARAVGIGVGLAMMDGPLPFMDIAAAGVATYLAADAWYDYFTS